MRSPRRTRIIRRLVVGLSTDMSKDSLQTHRLPVAHTAGLDRRLRVWLPRGYDETTQRYPVLYLLDGQNLFGSETAFGGVAWRAGATAQRLIDAGRMSPVILVGIDNAGAGRIDEYTPVAWQGRGGRSESFGRMLVDRIKPFVDHHYRTLPGRASTAIGGSSLGGLFSLWLALERSDVFGQVMGMSPSVWWGNGHICRFVAALPDRLPVRIWLDVGKQEVAKMRQGTLELAEQLLAKGWKKHRTARLADLRHVEIARSRHDEASWGRRLDRALPFLFPPPPKRPRRKAKVVTGNADLVAVAKLVPKAPRRSSAGQ